MSDTGNIPAAMVEAAARAIPRIPNVCPDPQCGDSTWDHECKLGGERLDYGTARAALAAAFAECEVTVNEGYRQRHPRFDDGAWHYCWDTEQTQGNAARVNRQWEGHYDPDGWTHEPVRRLVVVTPAQEGSNG